MFRTDDIRSLSDFRKNATAHLDRIAETGAIEILTVNGEARGVLMSPKVFDEMAEQAHRAETTAAILRGMADAEAGRTAPAREALKSLAAKHGLTLPG